MLWGHSDWAKHICVPFGSFGVLGLLEWWLLLDSVMLLELLMLVPFVCRWVVSVAHGLVIRASCWLPWLRLYDFIDLKISCRQVTPGHVTCGIKWLTESIFAVPCTTHISDGVRVWGLQTIWCVDEVGWLVSLEIGDGHLIGEAALARNVIVSVWWAGGSIWEAGCERALHLYLLM